ncbi:MAG: hypothetical protein B6D46_07885 [Polyangiaceae bacterium UTPRO1]|jgi:4'-phosphopantetheinyl transferase|nr:MAG: hypothetical protein B6D46_07885 [Polyangiaceae bacterium UTPRO1]
MIAMDDRVPSWCTPVATPWADVRLHRLDLDAAAGDSERLTALLAPSERERAALFRRPDDRLRFVAARAVLRLLLAAAGRGRPERLEIVADAYGKPALRYPSPLRFNVAHSGAVALVALAADCDVGVDVEVVRERAELGAVAARFFAPAESHALGRLTGAVRTAAFHRAWVRKEACVKAAGLGLRVPLQSVEVGVAPRPGSWRVAVEIGGAPRSFRVADVAAPAGYAAAIAAAVPVDRERTR